MELSLDQLPLLEMEPLRTAELQLAELCQPEDLRRFAELADSLTIIDSPASNWSPPPASLTSPSPSTLSAYSSSLSSCSPKSFQCCWPPEAGGRKRRQRTRNAVAAERYRRKLKGRICSLAEEMRLEERRREKLQAEIERKLTIYKEFAGLLSSQVHQNDVELAKNGLNSISNVLSIAAAYRADYRDGLDEFRQKFEIIANRNRRQLQLQQQQQQQFYQQQARKEEEEDGLVRLEYDFYSDSFVEKV